MIRLLVLVSIGLCRFALGIMIAAIVYAILGRGPAGKSVVWGLRILRRVIRF
jgi:hypothetical protein